MYYRSITCNPNVVAVPRDSCWEGLSFMLGKLFRCYQDTKTTLTNSDSRRLCTDGKRWESVGTQSLFLCRNHDKHDLSVTCPVVNCISGAEPLGSATTEYFTSPLHSCRKRMHNREVTTRWVICLHVSSLKPPVNRFPIELCLGILH
jgi:hypothetical protein